MSTNLLTIVPTENAQNLRYRLTLSWTQVNDFIFADRMHFDVAQLDFNI